MKILYAQNTNGLYHLFYQLFKNDINLHNNLLLELYENKLLSFLSNDLSLNDNKLPNCILIDNNLYFFDTSIHSFRLDEKFHTIIQNYNNNYINIKFKDIEEKDLDRFIIISAENDAENVYFKY